MSQIAMSMPETVQSVVQSSRNGPLIAAAAQLWINDKDRVLDMTYGRGNFWTEYRPAALVTNDLNPETAASHNEDFRSMSFGGASFDVVVFDPPYITPGGRETTTTGEMWDAYGLLAAPATRAELEALFVEGMGEAERLLTPKGRLMVKCMDFVGSGGMTWMRQHVVETARAFQLRQVDEFVHYSGTGPQPSGRRQHHSRRAHSFLCIFQKPRAAVERTE